MLSKVFKIAGIALGGTILYNLGKLTVDVAYTFGYRFGELATLNVLSELDNMCEGMSSEYIAQFNDWKNGRAKGRLTSSETLIPQPFPYEIFSSSINEVCLKHITPDILNSFYIEDRATLNYCHQMLIKRWLSENSDEGFAELRFNKSSDVEFSTDILQQLAVENNALYVNHEKWFSYIGLSENVNSLGDAFWTSYNLMAIEAEKPCIPIGRYTPDTRIKGDE